MAEEVIPNYVPNYMSLSIEDITPDVLDKARYYKKCLWRIYDIRYLFK